MLVTGFAGAVGVVGCDADRNAIERQLELTLGFGEPRFALTQRLFGTFALVDIDPNAVPAIDGARLVPMWKSATLKPSIHAIGSPEPRLEAVWLAEYDRL